MLNQRSSCFFFNKFVFTIKTHLKTKNDLNISQNNIFYAFQVLVVLNNPNLKLKHKLINIQKQKISS